MIVCEGDSDTLHNSLLWISNKSCFDAAVVKNRHTLAELTDDETTGEATPSEAKTQIPSHLDPTNPNAINTVATSNALSTVSGNPSAETDLWWSAIQAPIPKTNKCIHPNPVATMATATISDP